MVATSIERLSAIPYGQARVYVCEDGDAVLVSYATAVAQVSPDGWVRINGLYSRTTARHIKAFIQEYAPEMEDAFGTDLYKQIKKMATEKFTLNRFTGEVQDW